MSPSKQSGGLLGLDGRALMGACTSSILAPGGEGVFGFRTLRSRFDTHFQSQLGKNLLFSYYSIALDRRGSNEHGGFAQNSLPETTIIIPSCSAWQPVDQLAISHTTIQCTRARLVEPRHNRHSQRVSRKMDPLIMPFPASSRLQICADIRKQGPLQVGSICTSLKTGAGFFPSPNQITIYFLPSSRR